jgi:hypothetical protein
MFSAFLVLVAGVAWPLCIELFLGPAPRALLLLAATRKRLYPYPRDRAIHGRSGARPAAKTQFATARREDFLADLPGMPIVEPQACRKRATQSRRLRSIA